jgi:hypothetical protein
MVEPGDAVPHFTAATVDGETFSYADLWQRKSLVLVALCGGPERAAEYARQLQAQHAALADAEAVAVVTTDAIPGLERGGVVVADRWGEIVYVAAGADAASQHAAAELVEWARHLQRRCPECEGEAR